jgi:hypothetical protein
VTFASRLLKTYWNIPAQQVETSVVLVHSAARPQPKQRRFAIGRIFERVELARQTNALEQLNVINGAILCLTTIPVRFTTAP